MQFNDFIEGCQILNKYYAGNGYPMNPSRDEIYFEPTKIPIEKSDFLRLIELWWVQEDWGENTTEYYPVSYWIAYTCPCDGIGIHTGPGFVGSSPTVGTK